MSTKPRMILMTQSSEILLHKLSRRQFRQRMDAGELQVCILPVAAIEQHLEHLSMEHDWRSVTLVAEAAARLLQPHVLVAEALMVGVSEHHMRHRGTLTLRAGTFLAAVEDLIDSLVRAGFRNILVLNGHGGNMAPLAGVWDQFVRRANVNLQCLSYFELLTAEDALLLESGHEIPTDLPGHAQEFETAIALAAFPENVCSEAVADQSDQTPACATAEVGDEFLRRIDQRLAAYLQAMIDGQRVAEQPPYFP